MEELTGLKGLIGNYQCHSCNKWHSFSEIIPNTKVRNFRCDHFNMVITIVFSKRLKIQVMTRCNKCYKQYNSESQLGCKDGKGNLIMNDKYFSQCCSNEIELIMSFLPEYYDQNEAAENYNVSNYNNMNNNDNKNNNINNNNNKINNNFNNSNFLNFKSFNNFGMMNNFMNMNSMFNNPSMNLFNQMRLMNNFNYMNNYSMNNLNNFIKNNFNNNNLISNNNNNLNSNINNNMNKINLNNNNNNNGSINYNVDMKFDSSNIIEFSKKKKLINFLDEKTNKNYKLYTSPELKVKTVLNDLLSQFPEIDYNNNRLEANGQNINPELYLGNCNLNDNSIIIIKT